RPGRSTTGSGTAGRRPATTTRRRTGPGRCSTERRPGPPSRPTFPLRFAADSQADEGGAMEVGIGLPTTIPGTGRDQVLEWARRAEARGFSMLGTIDRLVYDSHEPLIALAAGRLVLGVAVGGREDDFRASGVDFHLRGRILDAMLDQWAQVWAGESFGT